MRRRLRVPALAILIGLASPPLVVAQPAAPAVGDAEFKCMHATSKASGKYWVGKIKCAYRCYDRFWDGDVPESDCLPPVYGGSTAQCIEDIPYGRSGIVDKTELLIRKSCDPAFKAGRDCPECYASGDCGQSGYAGIWTSLLGSATDSFIAGVFCERAGAFILEGECQIQTARRLARYVYAASKCYDKCWAYARKGIVPFGDCFPPAADPLAQACLAKARDTAAYYMHKACDPPPATPDGCEVPYQTPEEWLDVARSAAESFVPALYCTE